MWNNNRNAANKSGYDVDLYNHEIDVWVGGWLSHMGEVISQWCDGVIARNGKVLDKADQEKEKLQRIIKQKQTAINRAVRELNTIKAEVLKYQREVNSYNKTMADTDDAMQAYTLAESQLKRLPLNDPNRAELQKTMQKNKARYSKWNTAWTNSENAYQNYTTSLGKQKKKENEIADLRSEGGTVNYRSVDSKRINRLKHLEENEQVFENVSAVNMKQNKKRIIDAFYDTKEIDYFSKAVVLAMNDALKGMIKGQALTEYEINELITELFAKIYQDLNNGYNILKVIVSNPDYCKTVVVDGKAQTIIDMNTIAIDDLMRPLNRYLSGKVHDYTLLEMRRIKTQKHLFVPEWQMNDQGNMESLCDNPGAYNPSHSDYNPNKGKKRRFDPNHKLKSQYMENDESKDDLNKMTKLLKTYVDTMAKLMQELVTQKLSKKAYINRITKEEATERLKSIINRVIKSKSSHLLSGYNLSDDTVVARLMRMAIGAHEHSSTNDTNLKSIIKGVMDYYVLYCYQKVLRNKQKEWSGDFAEEERLENYILKLEEQKKKIKQKVLTAKSRKKSRRIIAKLLDELTSNTVIDEDYASPDEMAEMLVRRNQKTKKEQEATPYMEDKVDFLLWGKEIPDGSGKHNEFVTTSPLRNVGDYGA